MNFIRKRTKDFYLLDSQIENIFINEYLPIFCQSVYLRIYVRGIRNGNVQRVDGQSARNFWKDGK